MNATNIQETAPPDPKIEAWIKKNKQRFKDKYGDKGEEILYGKAWNMYNKETVDIEALLTEALAGPDTKEVIAGLKKLLVADGYKAAAKDLSELNYKTYARIWFLDKLSSIIRYDVDTRKQIPVSANAKSLIKRIYSMLKKLGLVDKEFKAAIDKKLEGKEGVSSEDFEEHFVWQDENYIMEAEQLEMDLGAKDDAKKKAVIVVAKSANAKTGKIATTYAAQTTCPSDCPLKNHGCYAEGGMVGMHTRRLNSNAGGLSIEELAQMEADEIDKLNVKTPLRVHVVGDCKTDAAAKLVSGAMERFKKRSGQPAYTYTHAWRRVSRSSWGDASVLASCENAEQIKQAHSRGYAAAVVVDSFPSDKAYMLDDVKVIPCPAQTKGKTCDACRLCMHSDKLLHSKNTIAFSVHGSSSKKAAAAISSEAKPETATP